MVSMCHHFSCRHHTSLYFVLPKYNKRSRYILVHRLHHKYDCIICRSRTCPNRIHHRYMANHKQLQRKDHLGRICYFQRSQKPSDISMLCYLVDLHLFPKITVFMVSVHLWDLILLGQLVRETTLLYLCLCNIPKTSVVSFGHKSVYCGDKP